MAAAKLLETLVNFFAHPDFGAGAIGSRERNSLLGERAGFWAARRKLVLGMGIHG